jgi:hypothetical protein
MALPSLKLSVPPAQRGSPRGGRGLGREAELSEEPFCGLPGGRRFRHLLDRQAAAFVQHLAARRRERKKGHW